MGTYLGWAQGAASRYFRIMAQGPFDNPGLEEIWREHMELARHTACVATSVVLGEPVQDLKQASVYVPRGDGSTDKVTGLLFSPGNNHNPFAILPQGLPSAAPCLEMSANHPPLSDVSVIEGCNDSLLGYFHYFLYRGRGLFNRSLHEGALTYMRWGSQRLTRKGPPPIRLNQNPSGIGATVATREQFLAVPEDSFTRKFVIVQPPDGTFTIRIGELLRCEHKDIIRNNELVVDAGLIGRMRDDSFLLQGSSFTLRHYPRAKIHGREIGAAIMAVGLDLEVAIKPEKF